MQRSLAHLTPDFLLASSHQTVDYAETILELRGNAEGLHVLVKLQFSTMMFFKIP